MRVIAIEAFPAPLTEQQMEAKAGFYRAVFRAADRLGATPTDIPGLWRLDGYPELTSGQLLGIARDTPNA